MTKAPAAMLLGLRSCSSRAATRQPPADVGVRSVRGVGRPVSGSASPGARPASTDPGTSPSIAPSLPPTAAPPTPTPPPSPPPAADARAHARRPPISEFPQSWTGTWQDPVTGGSGSLELTLNGKGSDFGGSITMDGTACLSTGILDGATTGAPSSSAVTQRAVEVRFRGRGRRRDHDGHLRDRLRRDGRDLDGDADLALGAVSGPYRVDTRDGPLLRCPHTC